MPIPGNLFTTALTVMPHTDVDLALHHLPLDVPCWPRLPNFSYFEERSGQAGEHSPGLAEQVACVESRTLIW